MGKTLLGLIGAAVAVTAYVGESRADVLTQYQFPTQNAAGLSATATNGVAASSIGAGAKLNVFVDNAPGDVVGGPYANPPWLGLAAMTSDFLTPQDALADGGYLEFSVTGSSMNLTSLSGIWSTAGSSGSRAFAVYTSLDGFATAGVQQGSNQSGLQASLAVPTLIDIPLTGLSNIDGTVTFRIPASFGSGGVVNNRQLNVDTLTLNGTIGAAVPEPATLGLLAAGFVGVLSRKRRV